MVLILAPLALVACVLGYWRYTIALATAEDLFDRSLLAATLAISRDVAVSGGDALSVTTRDLITEAAGGQVFYHVSGPDRSYMTGYAYPPVPPSGAEEQSGIPLFYRSQYRGAPIRALRLLEQSEIGTLSGRSVVTVWQQQSDRHSFAERLALQSALLIAILLAAVALIMWFAVSRGLRPLADLEEAIAVRTSDDLTEIRRPVPKEVRGVVSTLNSLFGQVSDALHARDVFISDAAHQLRNPVAGMLALAEAAEKAGSESERRQRVGELRASAERTARLTTQMLAIERARGKADRRAFEMLDLGALSREVAARNAGAALQAEIAFDYRAPEGPVAVFGDRVLLEEALENLIDNALRHGPPTLSRVAVELRREPPKAVLTVRDDGCGLAPEDAAKVFERFGQLSSSEGSGLGLAFVFEVAAAHEAEITIDAVPAGASLSLKFTIQN
jgi:two-component system sensor histidine kinase TctE